MINSYLLFLVFSHFLIFSLCDEPFRKFDSNSDHNTERELCSTSDLLYQCRNIEHCGRYIDDLEDFCEIIRGLAGDEQQTEQHDEQQDEQPTSFPGNGIHLTHSGSHGTTTGNFVKEKATPFPIDNHKPVNGNTVIIADKGNKYHGNTPADKSYHGNTAIDISRDIRVPARITVEPRNITVPPGATAQFNCRSEGAPVPLTTISRLMDGIDTPDQEKVGSEKVTSVSVIQEIEGVTKINQGWYRCVAANAFGIDIADAYLTVRDLCDEVKCGTRQMCQADYVTESTACVCPRCTKELDVVCGTDCNTYFSPCLLNKHNCENQSNVGVFRPGNCPGIVEPEPVILTSDELYFTEGERLRLTCVIADNTNPPAKIHWIRVAEDGQYHQLSDTLILEVDSLREADAGNYQCVAQQCDNHRHVSNHVMVNVARVEGPENLEIEKNVCSVFGDPHFITFDDFSYDFMGVCDYVLAMDCFYATWLVYGRFETCSARRNRGSCLNSVTVFSGISALELQRGWIINNQGNKMNITEGQTFTENDMTIIFDGRYLILSLDHSGIEIHWDGLVSVHILVPPGTETCGMCGNNDLNPDNDLIIRNSIEGENKATIEAVGKSWAVDRFDNCKMAAKPGYKCSLTSRRKAIQKCESAFSAPGLQQCARLVDPAPFKAGCVFDVCSQTWLAEQLSPECNAVSSYVQRCSIAGIRIFGWEVVGCPALHKTQDIILSQGCPQDTNRLLRRRT